MVHLERNFRNVIQLAVAFAFINFGLYGHQYIFKEAIVTKWNEGDIKGRDSAADIANTIYYISFGFSCLIAPAIIGFVGAKVSTMAGTMLIFSHIFTMIFFKPWLCFLTSGLQGLGFALLWAAQGKLLKLNSTIRTADKYTNTFFGICYSSTFLSAIFLICTYIITQKTDGYSELTLTVIYVFMSISIGGGFLTLFFMKMPSKHEMTSSTMTIENGTLATNTYVEIVLNVFKVLFKKKFIKYVFMFIHFGMSCTVWSSLIPNTISASEQFGTYRFYHMAGCCFVQGISQLAGAGFFFFYGPKLKKLTRMRKTYIGVAFTFAAYFMMLLTIPPKANQGRTDGNAHIQMTSPYFVYVPSALIGLGDIIFKIQITTHIMDVYPDQSGEVFSLFNGLQGVGMAAIFTLSIYITLDFIMGIVMGYLLVGLYCFYVAEKKLLDFYRADSPSQRRKPATDTALERYMKQNPDDPISKGMHTGKYTTNDLLVITNNNTLDDISEQFTESDDGMNVGKSGMDKSKSQVTTSRSKDNTKSLTKN
uniref:UNC93-like protein n=1 Tax=Parastrongyloides trichosuri TaxID=131310 RepID=A0A0N4ZI95_PARTI